MLNRRSFFKFLGKAVLGTVIALNLPETLTSTKTLEALSPTNTELYPKLITDNLFTDIPFFAVLRQLKDNGIPVSNKEIFRTFISNR